MRILSVGVALLTACLALRLAAADPSAPASTPDDQKQLEEKVRLRLAEHALKKAAKPAPVANPATTPGATPVTPAPAADATTTPTPATAATPPEDPATLLPRVEVSKERITQLAIQLQEKDREIAAEKRNMTPTTLDTSLNDPNVSHKLAILGGSSSEDRARLAQERVSLLEAEKDLLQEISNARTKEEREELEKTLNEMRTMRRELERAPRDERK